MKGKIAYFIPGLKLAGTSTQALAFCDAMHEAGYDVELVASSRKGVFLEAVSNKPYAVHYLHDAKRFPRLCTIYYLARYLRKHRPAILFGGAKRINKLAIYAHLLSFRASRLGLILTNELLQKKGPEDKGRVVSRLWHLLIYRSADKIVVLTDAMKQTLLKAGYKDSKVDVIAPPINTVAIMQKSLEPLEHPWLLTPKSKRKIPVILSVGRIAAQKNYPDILKAFKIATETRPLRLIILGSGNKAATAEITKLAESFGISDMVDFIGFSSNPFNFMRHSDVFALSSHWEGFGIVLAEALACGQTIVSVDCPDGPREILKNGECGYLAKLHNPESLAQSMLEAVDAPIMAEKLIKCAQAYDSKTIGKKYQALIKTLNEPMG